MKRMKRWIVLILSLILTCTLVAVGVWANTPDGSAELEVHYEVIPYRLNPVYEGVITLEDLDLPELPDKQPDADIMGINYVSEDKAAKEIRQHLIDRKETFSVHVLNDYPSSGAQFDRLCDKAMAHTGEGNEGDYLLWHCGAMGARATWTYIGDKYGISYTFSVSYHTTVEQEAEVDAAVDQLLLELNLGGKSDYEKVCAVYDYMCENITYDYENLEDDTYLLKFTAYAALIDKTAVCQGYASLFYRLMLELGVDSRVIPGDGGGPHGWNIVELGNLYYNVDSTWDAGMEEYNYFLKNTWNFLGHYRYLDYETFAFHNEFPMAAEDYEPGIKGQKDSVIYKDICGETATWTLTRDGKLTIEGTGLLENYADRSSMWETWQEGLTEVVIGEGITKIDSFAFYGMNELAKVTFPSTLETIGGSAFRGCAIKEIQLPDGLTAIGNYSFCECGSLQSITIPDSVTYLGESAFMQCYSLKKLHIGSGVTELRKWVFGGCTALTEVDIPGTVQRINDSFSSCTGLRSVRIDAAVIGQNAFSSCTGLKNLVLTDNVTIIEWNAFRDCTSLKEIYIPDSVTSLSGFTNCSNLTKVRLPENLIEIGDHAFHHCIALKSIDLPETLERIGWSAFEDCVSLKEVDIPDSVTSIEQNAFHACDGLTEITIPRGVTEVSGFSGCHNLVTVNLHDRVTRIKNDAFAWCTALVNLQLPVGVTHIERGAFRNCTSLKELVVPTTVKFLGWESFCGVTASIYFQGNAPAIDSSAFNGAVLTAYYPRNNKTWTEEVRQNYGGTITWEPYGVCEHETELRDMKDPTCTEPGYTGDTYCTICGAMVDRGREIPPLGHTYETAVTEPTCAEAGYTTYTCTVCGESHQDDFVDPLPHTYETVVTEPTCTEQGYTTYTCTICGESHQDDFVDPLGHLWDDEDAQVKTCVRCGFRFEGFMISFALDETVPVSSVWIDGVEYPVTASGEGYSVLLEEPDAVSMVVYLYNDPNAEDIHTQYPIGMRVWMLSFTDNAYTATYVPEFDDLLQYYGTSIRITGNKGIRMITSLTKSNKSALTGDGLAGYKLLEYGTALCFASDLDGGLPMILGETYVRSNFAYKRDVADPVFSYEGDLMNYTNVLVGFSLDQCKDDIAMRPYIILEDAQGNSVTLYGGIVYRSIGYVALQNRNVFKPGSGSYDYVWEIIHHVYGDQYDADYKG